MKMLKDLKYILSVALIILILMLLKGTGNHSFPGDLQKTAGKIASRAFLITPDQITKLAHPAVLLSLDQAFIPPELQKYQTIRVKFADILSKDINRQLANLHHTLVIIHNDPSMAVKAWIFLSQKGIGDLYVLNSDPENTEKVNYTFIPDTTVLSGLEAHQE